MLGSLITLIYVCITVLIYISTRLEAADYWFCNISHGYSYFSSFKQLNWNWSFEIWSEYIDIARKIGHFLFNLRPGNVPISFSLQPLIYVCDRLLETCHSLGMNRQPDYGCMNTSPLYHSLANLSGIQACLHSTSFGPCYRNAFGTYSRKEPFKLQWLSCRSKDVCQYETYRLYSQIVSMDHMTRRVRFSESFPIF